MSVPEPLQQALELLRRASTDQLRLFVVRRELKDGLKRHSRIANKYDYNALRASTSEEARANLLSGICDHVERNVADEDLDVRGYDLIVPDDADSLYTYSSEDLERLSFARSVEAIRGDTSSLPKIDWESGETAGLHGYALAVREGEMDVVLFNRLKSQSVHQPYTTKTRLFGISGDELRPVKHTVLSFDVRVSCVLVNGELYILSKKQFEDLVGFTEELERNAHQVLDELKEIGLLAGLDVLRSELDKSSRLLWKMASLAKKGHLTSFSQARLEKMKEMAKAYNLDLPLDDEGRLVITDRKDIPNVIKWLSDSFVVSPQTDALYDAPVKHRLNGS